MCLYIVDNVLTYRIIYFRYVDADKRIDNSPNHVFAILVWYNNDLLTTISRKENVFYPDQIM